MAKIWVGPTGNLVRGDVLDVSKAALLRKLRDYDALLYVTWNPKKLQGMGCWEIRRRPEKKTVVESVAFAGNTIHRLDYKENDLVNHVVDCHFLTYNILEKIKKMDTWAKYGHQGEAFTSDFEYREAKAMEAEEDRANQERTYNLKQHKSLINDLREYVLSGHNPARLADYWGQIKKGSN